LNYNHIRFIGGGRWATTVLTELAKTFPHMTIDWVFNSNVNKKIELTRSSVNFKNVNPVANKDIEGLQHPDKLIIASHSSQHCSDLLIHRNGGTDVLIEKPLFPNFSDFEALSEFDIRHIFFNLEFYNAYFIRDFFDEVKSLKIEDIEIVWHDPLVEMRSDEDDKYSEIYSSIFMDQLLHVMSICKVLELDTNNYSIIKIVTDDDSSLGGIQIHCDFSGVLMLISLSRFANRRERKIVLNSGMVALDFGSLPVIEKKGKPVKKVMASGRLHPISQTLSNFLNFPGEDDSFSISVKSLISEIKFCFECEDLFIERVSGLFNSVDGYKYYSEEVNPILIYYLGILYYRQVVSSKQNKGIHFLKGDNAVQNLLRWRKNYNAQ